MPVAAESRPPATEALRIADFLGIDDLVRDRISLAGCVAGGLPVKAAETVREKLGARVFYLILPEATYRRARRQARPLTRETSEKLYEFGRVYALALRIYRGDRDRVMRFLERPHPMLAGQAPIELATSSSAGADAVIDLLNRAEAGFAA
jgi:putative toxin-antitoxin system antitoxin component (TIGR02293 family)